MKVKATDEYVKRNLKDKELDRIPVAGEIFEVSKERYEVLTGNNPFNAIFVEKLENYKEPIQYVNPLMEHTWGQKVIRLYDPDGNLIEVGTPM